MVSDNEHSQPSSSLVDPRVIATLATLALAVVPYGVWRARARSTLLENPAERSDDPHSDQITYENDPAKPKRSKERRKRAPAPKVKVGAAPAPKKQAVHQSSAIPQARKSRAVSVASVTGSEPSSSVAESFPDETPKPSSVSRFEDPPHRGRSPRSTSSHQSLFMSTTQRLRPENVPLPPSPNLLPSRHARYPSPAHSRRSSPTRRLLTLSSPPSPSASTSASTSGTPLTPPSLMNSQVLPMAPIHSIYTQEATWEWAKSTPLITAPPTIKDTQPLTVRHASPSPQTKPRSTNVPPTSTPHHTPAINILRSPTRELSFPTLNSLPPPSTPLEDQIQILRSTIEASKSREHAAIQKEQLLVHELERSRLEAEMTRQENARLQFDFSQREEQLLSKIQALSVQVQALHHTRQPAPLSMPMGHPAFQPQPIPYPPPHLYSHPFSPTSPMPICQPQPQPHTPNVVFPAHMNVMRPPPSPVPRMPSGQHSNTGPSTPLDTLQHPPFHIQSSSQPNLFHDRVEETDLRIGLLEAIMKHPNSLRTTGGSAGSSSVTDSLKSTSVSVSGSVGSANHSRSASVAGSRSSDTYESTPSHADVMPIDTKVVLEEVEETGEDTPSLTHPVQEEAFPLHNEHSITEVDVNQTAQHVADQGNGSVAVYY